MIQASSLKRLFKLVVVALTFGPMAGVSMCQSAASEIAGAEVLSHPADAVNDSSEEAATPKADSNTLPARAGTSYATALNGAGLIPLDAIRHLSFNLGATTSFGWDSNPQDLAEGKASSVYNLSPYVGLQASSNRTQVLIQYQPTIVHYGAYAGSVMQLASAHLLRSLSPQWDLAVTTTGSHGQDSIRFAAPNQAVSVGAVSGTSPASASYLENAGDVTHLDGSIEVSGDLSARRAVRFGFTNSYSSVPSLKEVSNVGTLKMTYEYSLHPSLTVQAYQSSSQYYGTISCTTFGAGVGVRWQPRDGVFFAASGGPQVDAPVCKAQQGASYNLSFATRLPQRSQMYLESAREPTSGYLGPALWQDSITAGYQRQVKLLSVLGVDVGFVHSSTTLNTSSYSGKYWDTTYAYKPLRGPTFSVSYRGYLGTSGSTSFTRNTTLVALSWTPNMRNQVH